MSLQALHQRSFRIDQPHDSWPDDAKKASNTVICTLAVPYLPFCELLVHLFPLNTRASQARNFRRLPKLPKFSSVVHESVLRTRFLAANGAPAHGRNPCGSWSNVGVGCVVGSRITFLSSSCGATWSTTKPHERRTPYLPTQHGGAEWTQMSLDAFAQHQNSGIIP